MWRWHTLKLQSTVHRYITDRYKALFISGSDIVPPVKYATATNQTHLQHFRQKHKIVTFKTKIKHSLFKMIGERGAYVSVYPFEEK